MPFTGLARSILLRWVGDDSLIRLSFLQQLRMTCFLRSPTTSHVIACSLWLLRAVVSQTSELAPRLDWQGFVSVRSDALFLLVENLDLPSTGVRLIRQC